MNTLELECIGRSIIGPIFTGVFAADMLPDPPKEVYIEHGCIANTQNRNEPGLHWCAFWYNKFSRPEYFDSYGMAPHITSFRQFLGPSFTYNSTSLQSFTSDVCGHYCLMYLIYKSRGIPMAVFLNQFSNLREKNDNIARDFVTRLHSTANQSRSLGICQTCKTRNICENVL